MVYTTQTGSGSVSSSQQRGAISGIVTDGATGKSLLGALVSLSDPKVKVSAGTVTDSKGRFVFTGLPASQGYTLRVQKSGYYNLGFGQSDTMFGIRAPVSLTEHEWRQNADVILWPFGSVSGTVVDELGEPVVGVPVRVLTRIAAGGAVRWAEGPRATTDDRGVYRVDQLRSGTYLVHLPNVQSSVPRGTTPAAVAGIPPEDLKKLGVTVPLAFGLDFGSAWLVLTRYTVPPPFDGVHRAYPPLFYSGSRSLAAAVPMDLADGEDKTSIDFVLQPVSTFSVSGRVVGPPEALARLIVRLLPSDTPVEGRNSEVATTLVGANGTFTILGVPQGNYTLVAGPSVGDVRMRGATGLGTPGLIAPNSFTVSFSSSGFVSSSPVGKSISIGRARVAVGDQAVTDVVLELHASTSISGRVVNEDGSPIRDVVRVSVGGTGDPTFMTLSAQVLPEAGPATPVRPDPGPLAPPGRFVIRDVPHGNYVIDANSMTAPSLVVKSIIGPDGDYADRPLQVMPGADIPELVITLTDRPATLRGVVRDRDGAIVPHAVVILFPADRRGWSHFGLSPSRIKSVLAADREGYALSLLRAGAYLVVATDMAHASAWHDTRFLEATAAVATPVTLDWGASTVLNLTRQQVIVR
jgi:hypothetical protein